MHGVIHISWSNFSIWDFYFDISEWHIPPHAHQHLCSSLHLTNPCTEPQLNPKARYIKRNPSAIILQVSVLRFLFLSQVQFFSCVILPVYCLKYTWSCFSSNFYNLVLLYNCGRIFFILSYFVGYILSFVLVRLRIIRLIARAGAHIECSSVTLARGGCDNDKCHNKTPDRNGTVVWMTSCPETRDWEFSWFLKKAVSWDLTLDEASWDLKLDEASPVGAYGMHRAFVGSDGTVSIVKIVSLSSHVEKLKVNKRFVPKLKKVISVSVFRDSYAYIRFTYSYFDYVTVFVRYNFMYLYFWYCYRLL